MIQVDVRWYLRSLDSNFRIFALNVQNQYITKYGTNSNVCSVLSFYLYRKLRFLRKQKKRMLIECMLDQHVSGHGIKTVTGSKDIKTFFAEYTVKRIVFIKKIVCIQKVILAHVANVLGCYSFRWIFYIFFCAASRYLVL